MNQKRGNVWLAVCGLVIDKKGRWLVVKKKYGGAKGKWTLPAGFVEAGETADEAVKREVLEETGIVCRVDGLLGLRTGVIEELVSDNMILFACTPENTTLFIQEREIEVARWMAPEQLTFDKNSSLMLRELMKTGVFPLQKEKPGLNPGSQFGYTAYKLFL
ncbi:NUDIX domain-containing protein [Siminovitchia sp. 179-K 8D1 HS]|uniref:NUDIX domain-containing protein n=1 Tax=Siminovitchia sp. 179-K 8D1 HS TaxID=3142385 RepID=UPI0039A024C6